MNAHNYYIKLQTLILGTDTDLMDKFPEFKSLAKETDLDFNHWDFFMQTAGIFITFLSTTDDKFKKELSSLAQKENPFFEKSLKYLTFVTEINKAIEEFKPITPVDIDDKMINNDKYS
ncbi:MAG: hypothetical protein COY68_03205 [Candidatus Levybacteria bacterium CG_4_10_14_0_8_um_filter_35_23]|nr:MAG: hypothetical protein COY68_03205 [Candidatus Levybacteria bacterium CG_4_10_14_0_8_um_filter_35_23]